MRTFWVRGPERVDASADHGDVAAANDDDNEGGAGAAAATVTGGDGGDREGGGDARTDVSTPGAHPLTPSLLPFAFPFLQFPCWPSPYDPEASSLSLSLSQSLYL
jgi:hypothetical protein